MTEITYSDNDNRYSIKATGHATGSEKVCSGISAIMYALAGWQANNTDITSNSIIKLTSGDSLIEYDCDTGEGQAAYDMAVIGLAQIARSYPDFCVIKKF